MNRKNGQEEYLGREHRDIQGEAFSTQATADVYMSMWRCAALDVRTNNA